jgi:peptidoglycan/LPS O-acetylase OafA/YrhL
MREFSRSGARTGVPVPLPCPRRKLVSAAAVASLLTNPKSETSLYRPDIDGLRAVSILLVVGFHAQSWLVPGGFVGVDIFFVISGFLITGIILGQIEGGRFSALGFYARRIRRIFPALIVVLLATYLIGWFLLLPDGFADLGQNIAASVAFVSNLLQLRQAGYFAPASADNPLLHLWSLGIEEQFYIVWPPVLLLIARTKWRPLTILALAAASFAVGLLIYAGYKEWSFYSPIPRAWELLAGSLLAERQIARHDFLKAGFARQHDLQAALGLALIAAGAFGLNSNSLFPGAGALLPVLGAVLLILSPSSFINRRILSSSAMVSIGLISYPLYLWHWPLLSYLGILRSSDANFLEIWAAVILAAILSYLTYRFVELPLRRRPDVVPKLALGLASIGVIGIVTAAASGFDLRFSPAIREIARIEPQNNSGLRDACFVESGFEFGSNCIEGGDKKLVFLWGDSTAAAFYPGLNAEAAAHGFRVAHFETAGCPPILNDGLIARCDELSDKVFAQIKASHPDILLVHAMWGPNNNLDRLRQSVDRLVALKIPRIIILGPVPVWKRGLPLALVNYYRFHHRIPDRIAGNIVSGGDGDARMQALSTQAGVEFISARDALCNAEGCLTRTGASSNDVIATDMVHLSESGSQFLARAIAKRIFK